MYFTYVVHLDNKALLEKRFEFEHPRPSHAQKEPLYIGTSSNPEKRIRQHLRGKSRSNPLVRRHYKFHTTKFAADTWTNAQAAEVALAKACCNRGHPVYRR